MFKNLNNHFLFLGTILNACGVPITNKIEVIDLISDFHFEFQEYRSSRIGAVGGILSNGQTPIICGGYHNELLPDCFILGSNTLPHKYQNKFSTSIITNELLCLIGGQVDGIEQSSMKLLSIKNDLNVDEEKLPFQISHHTIVTIDENKSYLIIGGQINQEVTKKTWILTITKKPENSQQLCFSLSKGPNLINGRKSHCSCKVFLNNRNYVIVTGGCNKYNKVLSSVEILDLSENQLNWRIGNNNSNEL